MDAPRPIDFARVARELQLTPTQVANVVELLDEGNTIPFITRYRKERTGNLDENRLRQVEARVNELRVLAERAEAILRLIDNQGKLTPRLRMEIERAESLKRLEDLYLPFRPRRTSRAEQARQRGLAPLADQIWNDDETLTDLQQAALQWVAPDKKLPDAAAVLQGASDILAERISEDPEVRSRARDLAWKTGKLVVSASRSAEETGQQYRDYFDYTERVDRIPPHRILAINRGEKEGALRVRFEWHDARVLAAVEGCFRFSRRRHTAFLNAAAVDALQRLVQPSLEREVRRELTDRAEAHAVQVFAENLRNLLLQPPLLGQRVVSVDPGFRTGCKVAALDERGQLLAEDVLYVTGSAEKKAACRRRLAEFLNTHQCRMIAIGNGTACREAEELVSETIDEHVPEARYVIVNEAGASIYSTSSIAGEEFADLDATVRGTISIGRRLQDPLSELVKIDPQHLGVGMYQHDVSPKLLKESLERVVESCVNYVGVDLNTASAALLRHVSGFNQLIARRVVAWREAHGRFRNRKQLLEVPGIGDATFTQAAGFLKVMGGDEPLDATWIHPESYYPARQLLETLGVDPSRIVRSAAENSERRDRLRRLDRPRMARELNLGLPTFEDIVEAFLKPGRDPRAELPGPLFRRGVLKLDDLHEGMELTGTVLNVVDFGVFVDIGIKDSGLVHISQMAPHFVKSPHDVAAVGNVVTVWVLGIDKDRRRVSLTMIPPGTPRQSTHAAAKPTSATNGSQGEVAAPRPAPREPVAAAAREQSVSRSARVAASGSSSGEPLRGFDELKELWKNRSQ